MVHRNRLTSKSRRQHQTANPRIVRMRQFPKSLPDNDPVLIQERHHIANRCQCGKSEKLSCDLHLLLFQRRLFSGKIRLSEKEQRQPEYHLRSADLRKSGFRLSGFRIRNPRFGYDIRRRENITLLSVYFLKGNFMMIRYDHGKPGILCLLQRTCRGNAVVAGNDGIHAVGNRLLHQSVIDPVAIANALRNRRTDLSPKEGNQLPQNIRGADPIHIIVSDDADPLTAYNLALQYKGSILKSGKQLRIIQICHCSAKIFADVLLILHVPVPDHTGRHGRDSEFL